MSIQTIEVEELPEGWKAVSYGWPKKNVDHVFDGIGVKLFIGKEDHAMLIVQKIQPRRIVLEDTEEERSVSYGDWFEDNDGTIGQWPDNQYGSQESYKVWREVKETDEPKLSLSTCECKGLFEGNQPAINKVKEFIKENS